MIHGLNKEELSKGKGEGEREKGGWEVTPEIILYMYILKYKQEPRKVGS